MEQTQSKQNSFMIPLAIVVAGALVAGAVYFSSSKTVPAPSTSGINAPATGQPTAPIEQPTAPAVNIADVDINGEPFIGDQNAPVTTAYWFDFQCPFCQRFEQQTLPTLVDKYVNAGKVKIVFKDFQFLGPDSQDAGLVENAIWELYPEQYKQWHDAMLAAQDGENSGFGNLDSILTLIKTKLPTISADKIARQVEQKKAAYQQELDSDKAEGVKFGINGTPGFVIGTQTISGAQPTSVFTQIIDAELSKTQ